MLHVRDHAWVQGSGGIAWNLKALAYYSYICMVVCCVCCDPSVTDDGKEESSWEQKPLQRDTPKSAADGAANVQLPAECSSPWSCYQSLPNLFSYVCFCFVFLTLITRKPDALPNGETIGVHHNRGCLNFQYIYMRKEREDDMVQSCNGASMQTSLQRNTP